MKEYKYIYRFTDVTALLYMLERKSITFLDPKKWPDKNDVYSVSRFEKLSEYEEVFALCFLKSSETSHHWPIYSPGISGCYIEFDKNELIKELKNNCNEFEVISNEINYVEINELKSLDINIGKLAFIKRYPYRGEEEFRILLASRKSIAQKYIDIQINLTCINQVCLSPDLPENIFNAMSDIIKKYNSEIHVKKTTLYDNKKWKNLIDQIEK